MDLKKTKIFSLILLISSILAIVLFFTLMSSIYALKTGNNSTNINNLILANNLETINTIVSSILLLIVLICWLSIIIQISRFDISFKECTLFIVLSIFSIIPVISLVIFLRIIYIERKIKDEKIELLIEEIENNEELRHEMKDKIEGLVSKKSKKNIFDFFKFNKEKFEENKYIDENVVDETFIDNQTYVNSALETDQILNVMETIQEEQEVFEDKHEEIFETTIEDFKQEIIEEEIEPVPKISKKKADQEVNTNNDLNLFFDRKKYLSLKGTNYSLEKKEGKKKISKTKWNKLLEYVDELEQGKITEAEFNKKRTELLK